MAFITTPVQHVRGCFPQQSKGERGGPVCWGQSSSLFTVLQSFPAPAGAVLGQFCLSPSSRKALGSREIQAVPGHASVPLPHAPWKVQAWPGEQEDAAASQASSPWIPAVVAGISHFRSRGRDSMKLPQFLETRWHVESVSNSPALFSAGI